MTVADATKLPDAPNIVCLAGAVAGEFRYTGKDGNTLLGVVKLPGTPNATWPAGTFAFRGISAYDTNALQARSMFATTPDLPNRVVYETDEAGNTLEIHQVYILVTDKLSLFFLNCNTRPVTNILIGTC